MSESEAIAPARYGSTAVVIANVVMWLLAFLSHHFVPEQTSHAGGFAIVLSGGIGGGWASTNSLKNVGLVAWAGTASTILILALYVPLTGLRLGMAVGGVGTAVDAILCFSAIYTWVFLSIFAVEFTANWLAQRRKMHNAEHD